MTFGNYQLEIYLQGLSGILPTLPMDYAGWEAKAEVAHRRCMPSMQTAMLQAMPGRRFPQRWGYGIL